MNRFSKSRLLGLMVAGFSVGALAIAVLASDWKGEVESQGDAASKIRSEGDVRSLPVLVMKLGELVAPARTDDYRGVLQPSKMAELAFRRSGKIKEILVEEGSVVTAGQKLATLECGDVEAMLEGTEARIREATATLSELEAGPRKQTIAAAEAEVRRLEALVELSKATVSREKQLQQTKASSAQAYDNARYNTEQQLASLDAAKEQLSELRAGTRAEQLEAQRARISALEAERKGYLVDLEDSQIVAPFSGVISRRYIDEGSIAGPQTLVLRLLQIDPIEAKFGLTPEDAADLSVGQELPITLGRTTIRGFVSNIEPEVDLATRTQAVLLSIPRTVGQPQSDQVSESNLATSHIVVGRTVSLSLTNVQQGTDTAFWVPLTALSKSTRGLWSLLVVTPNDQGEYEVARRDIQVQETDTRLARITGGMISRGDMFVADGTHRVTPGMIVDPIINEELLQDATLSSHANTEGR